MLEGKTKKNRFSLAVFSEAAKLLQAFANKTLNNYPQIWPKNTIAKMSEASNLFFRFNLYTRVSKSVSVTNITFLTNGT